MTCILTHFSSNTQKGGEQRGKTQSTAKVSPKALLYHWLAVRPSLLGLSFNYWKPHRGFHGLFEK